MVTIATHAHSINLAKEYITKPLWIAFGGSSFAWVDDNNPPYPSLDINKFTDLTGLLYVDIKRLVSKHPSGSIVTKEGRYVYADSSLSTQNLINSDAFYLYLEGTLPIDSPIVNQTFRLLGLAENVRLTNPSSYSLAKGLFIASDEVIDYDLSLVSSVPAFTVNNAEEKFQFIRRF